MMPQRTPTNSFSARCARIAICFARQAGAEHLVERDGRDDFDRGPTTNNPDAIGRFAGEDRVEPAFDTVVALETAEDPERVATPSPVRIGTVTDLVDGQLDLGRLVDAAQTDAAVGAQPDARVDAAIDPPWA